MENQKNENVYLNLISNDENWMEAFRKNLGVLKSHYKWSVRVLSEKSGISESTLNNIIQGKTRDCDVSLIIKLAKTFNVSMDELTGAGTIPTDSRQTIAMTRYLDEHVQKVIKIYAKHQYLLHANNITGTKEISVITPECLDKKLTRTSLADEKISLSKIPREIQNQVGFGIRIPCDHYEPHFLRGETILLGFDREGENNEMCVISSEGSIYICIKKIQFINGKKETHYVAITNRKKIFSWEDIDDRFGYVVGFLHPDLTWGIR